VGAEFKPADGGQELSTAELEAQLVVYAKMLLRREPPQAAGSATTASTGQLPSPAVDEITGATNINDALASWKPNDRCGRA